MYVFAVSRKECTIENKMANQKQPTQVAAAFERRGSHLIVANGLQGQRAMMCPWRTFQHRLVSELRLVSTRGRQEICLIVLTTTTPDCLCWSNMMP